MPTVDRYIIRTSDRGLFRKCRQLWDFTSKIRLDFEPVTVPKALEFGTAIHRGLEVYYDPDTQDFPNETRLANAIVAFVATNNEQWIARDIDDPVIKQDYEERHNLGRDMLTYYCGEWAPQNDKFRVISVEQEFEVPVLVPQDAVRVWDTAMVGDIGSINFSAVLTDHNVLQLFHKGSPVVYQGRIDLIVEDEDGEIWIIDHKTAAAFKEDNFHLDVDTQVTSYAWAAQYFLDKLVAGVIYTQIKKSVPQEPALVYKGTKLSKDKSQSTTYDYYVKAIEKHGFNESDYDEFLDHLWKNEPKFVRRFELHRSKKELDNQARIIYDEALDMLDDPRIYPNPHEFHCNKCPFQGPCLARIEDSDPEFMLSDPSSFRKRDE